MKKNGMAILLALLMLFGCIGTAAADGVVELEFFSLKPEAVNCYESLIERFNAENPDIHVSLTSTADAQTVFLTRVSTNDIPPVDYLFTTANYIAFYREGLFEDLTGDPLLELVEPGIVEMAAVDGRNYCVPVTLSPAGIYYNVDLFNEKGYAYPATYEELIALCEKMVADGVTPFAFSDKTVSTIGQQAERILGGNINYNICDKFAAVGAGETSWTEEPELRRLAEVILELRKYCAPDNLGTAHEDALAAFVNQEVAMVFSGTWAASTINDGAPAFNYEMLAFPAIDGVEPYLSTNPDTSYGISASATDEEKAAAYRFIEFLLSKEAMEEWLGTDLSPNMSKNIEYNVPVFAKINEMLAEGKLSMLPVCLQPAGFRNEWQVLIQQMLIDGDIDAFLEASDELCLEYYN